MTKIAQTIEKDIEKWNLIKVDWKGVLNEYNTGKDYTQKQDLVALFWNSYVYYEQRFETYFRYFGKLPTGFIDKLIFEFRQNFPKRSGRVDGVNYFDDLLEQFAEKYRTEFEKKEIFTPETENLKDWIYPNSIPNFTKIEEGLFQRGFIDNSYHWKKHKTDLVEFACLIMGSKYFKPVVKGKRIQDFHKRQFISERYGFGKTGLTETWKKKKPTFKISKASYYWINIPD